MKKLSSLFWLTIVSFCLSTSNICKSPSLQTTSQFLRILRALARKKRAARLKQKHTEQGHPLDRVRAASPKEPQPLRITPSILDSMMIASPKLLQRIKAPISRPKKRYTDLAGTIHQPMPKLPGNPNYNRSVERAVLNTTVQVMYLGRVIRRIQDSYTGN